MFNSSGATPRNTVYTIGQLAGYVKTMLDTDPVMRDIWVTGEVSNHRQYGSGHQYFSLTDTDSKIQCVMFRGGHGSEFLTDGNQVLAHGRISFYTNRGDLQFYIDRIKPEGIGALQIAFEQLREKLEKEGLFAEEHKRALPRFPRRVGIVTSPSGAVLHDVLNVLSRRWPLAEVLLAPTLVQGEGAASSIVDALGTLNSEITVDVAIIARGGGSLEDLWPFNEEEVARAIFNSRIPIVSAVGHEVDNTIADLVSDMRAPTPSAAAELISPDRQEILNNVSDYIELLVERTSRSLHEKRVGFSLAGDRLDIAAPDSTTPRVRVDELLRHAILDIERHFAINRERLRGMEMKLQVLCPDDILSRGYAIVRRGPGGPVLSRTEGVLIGDMLDLTLTDGSIKAQTIQINSWKG